MALNPIQKGQTDFLMRGGAYEMPMMQLREKGIIPEVGAYIHQEYPKMVSLHLGAREIPMQTEDCKGRTLHWTETREAVAHMIVQSEREEDAIHEAFERAQSLGIAVQEHWTQDLLLHAVSLAEAPKPRRNAPRPTPAQIVAERIATLKAELAALEPHAEDPEPAEALEAATAPLAPTTPPGKRHRAATDLPVVAPDPAV
jgi:hypothetical protein